jgi:hypothetical protein
MNRGEITLAMPQPYSVDHIWVGATHVTLPTNLVRQAVRRGTVRIPQDTKIDVLEVYCLHCRRPYDDVDGQPCEAAEHRDHLIGGPVGERAKRKHPHHDCERYGCTIGQEPVTDTGTVG